MIDGCNRAGTTRAGTTRGRTAQMESDIVQRSERQQQANTKLRLVVDAATDAFVAMDDTGRITDWNRQAEATFGWRDEEVFGLSLADTIIPPQHRAAHQAGLAKFLATGETNILNQRTEMTAVDRHGREFPVELTMWAVGDGTGTVSFHAFVHDVSERSAYADALRDSETKHRLLADQLSAAQQIAGTGSWEEVTERVALEQELAALALFDELTGLHNRRGFLTLAEHQLEVASRADRPVPLLFVDMDGMKTINDTYGHSEGDRALVQVAKFLRTALRASDLVARVGGDEFCILMVDGGGGSPIDVDRVVTKLRSGPPRGQRPYPLPLSVGVAQLEPGSATSIEDLMRRADGAMYEDKNFSRRLPRVLVVEDDASLRRLTEMSLRFSYDVVSAATGSAALEEVAEGERLPDLILLDLKLQDMYGAEVLRRLRAVPGGDAVSVIVMTGEDGRNAELESLRESVDDFVVKPIDLDVLEARIKNVLRRSSPRPRRLGS